MAERYKVVLDEDPEAVVLRLENLKRKGWETIVVPTPIVSTNPLLWYAVLLTYHDEEVK